jgi:CRP-like cAMP-binding protein
MTTAISHQPHVDVRLHMLFWHLADRWGHERPEGTTVPLPLTHDVLAHLVGARRPTVSTALARLANEGLVRRHKGRWLLAGDPPNPHATGGPAPRSTLE